MARQRFPTLMVHLLTCILLLLPACSRTAPPSISRLEAVLPELAAGWQAAHLRLQDPSDTPLPDNDLLAVYARRSQRELQLRLDFLDLQPGSRSDLYLALEGGGKAASRLPIDASNDLHWDTLLVYPATGEPYALGPSGAPLPPGASLSAAVDPQQDTVFLQFSGSDVAKLRAFQVFVTPPGVPKATDQTAPVRFDAPAPARAPLLLAFWDVFPAATPAQALRRWDGAHTGPLGQRHGLLHLLQASSGAQMPLFLLDLKTPSALSALDFLGRLDDVRNLQEQGLLILPDCAYGDPQAAETSLRLSREAAQDFNLAKSNLVFGAFPPDRLPQSYRAAFAVQSENLRVHSAGRQRLIPLPALYSPGDVLEQQVDAGGLSLPARRALLSVALSEDGADIVVLGGSLPGSPWADSSVAPQALRYLAEHPWIQVLDEDGLLALPAAPADDRLPPVCADLLCTPPILPVAPYTSTGAQPAGGSTQVGLRTNLRAALEELPPGPLTRLAWEMYLQLTLPSADPYRQALQTNYLGGVGHLIRLARWSDHPAPAGDCSDDIDGDGQAECVLADERSMVTFETDGARILFAATRTASGAVQWSGPFTQAGAGWSDPLDWKITLGPASDPNEVPGAFVDEPAPFRPYRAGPQAGQITFTAVDGSLEKTFRLLPGGIQATYRGSLPQTVRIPLTLAPQQRFRPGWAGNYAVGQGPGSVEWRLSNGPALSLSAQGASLSADTFLDSAGAVQAPENPEHPYPPGHFLPFPLALVKLQPAGAESAFTVELRLHSTP